MSTIYPKKKLRGNYRVRTLQNMTSIVFSLTIEIEKNDDDNLRWILIKEFQASLDTNENLTLDACSFLLEND